MSRTQRRAGNPVSLFPFLAVLLCTMGSLALLLLVTTHRIRHDAILWAEAETLAKADIERERSTVMVIEAEPSPTAAPTPPAKKSEPEPPPPPVIDLNAQLERIVAGLINRRDARKQELRNELTALNSVTKNVEQVAEQLTRVEGRLAQSRVEQRKHIAQVQALGERHASVAGQVDQAEQRLRALRQQTASATTKYAFVPYDGASGTVRRPILIECTNKGMRFLPEGISLSAADLEGSSVHSNPLLAGALSLVDFWSTTGRDPSDRKPYVLLVVRPSGSTAYYAARKLLSGLDQPSGYELLGETEELDLPAADPRAVSACRRAVEKALANRSQAQDRSLVGRDRNWSGSIAGSGEESSGKTKLGVPVRDRKDERIAGRTAGPADSRNGTPADVRQGALVKGHNDGRSEVRTAVTAGTNPDEKLVAASNGKSTSAGRAPSCDVDSIGGKLTANQPADVQGLYGEAAWGQTTTAQPPGAQDGSSGTLSRSGTGARAASLSQSGNVAGQTAANPTNTRSLGGSQNGNGKGGSEAGDASDFFPKFGATANGASGQDSRNNPFTERRWGIHGPRANIGFERRVVIYVDTHQLVIGNERPIPIDFGESREQLAARTLQAIESEVRAWGQPPEHFYWSPSPHFVVSPGGNQYYEPLKTQAALWGLSSTVEFRLDPYKPSRGPE